MSKLVGNEQPGAEPLKQTKEYDPSFVFRTAEEIAAAEGNTVRPYLRLEDSLCRRFLQLATDPREFAGLRLLFPFVREASVLRAGRGRDKFAGWMTLAFLAGHDLGRAHPDHVEDVLPDLEFRETMSRLAIIQRCSGEENLTLSGLRRACGRIVNEKWPDLAEHRLEDALLEAVVKSMRTGFAAATVARCDPVRCDFVCDIPERTGAEIKDIVGRALVGAPLNAVGRPVMELLEHPLLRLARDLHPSRPTERDTVLSYIRHRLFESRVRSENECPTSELDLIDWIGAGIDYGRRVKADRFEVVEKIFKECGERRLNNSLRIVRQVVAEAGGTEPVQLLGRLKVWQEGVYGWSEPGFYGEELARVAYFSDFAVWIPWGL
jgi:hypothetical protein